MGNQEVQVKHAADFKLRWAHKPEGELLRGLMFVSPEHTTTQQLTIALKRLNLSPEHNIMVINKLLNHQNLSHWVPQLSRLRQTLHS